MQLQVPWFRDYIAPLETLTLKAKTLGGWLSPTATGINSTALGISTAFGISTALVSLFSGTCFLTIVSIMFHLLHKSLINLALSSSSYLRAFINIMIWVASINPSTDETEIILAIVMVIMFWGLLRRSPRILSTFSRIFFGGIGDFLKAFYGNLETLVHAFCGCIMETCE